MIRAYTAADIPECLEHIADLYQESPHFRRYAFEMVKGFELFWANLENPDFAGLIAIRERELRGFLFGFVVDAPFDTARRASDLVLYVPPAFRHGFVSPAFRLVRAFERWAAGRGATDVQLGVSTDLPDAPSLYDRMGYHRYGSLHTKDLG